MNTNTEKNFDKCISILNKMGIKNKDIIVTGSYALDILGVLPDDHKIHDFDCIVRISNENINVFNQVCDMFKSDKTPSCMLDDEKMIEVNGMLLNIWINQPNEHAVVSYKGIGVKGMLDILKVKKKYKRPKDYKDISQIAGKILN